MPHAEASQETKRKALWEWSVPVLFLAVTGTVLAARGTHAPSRAADASVAEAPISDGKRYQVPVSASQPTLGKNTALVTLVLWSDLDAGDQRLQPVLETLRKRYGDDLRLVFRHLIPQQNAALLPLHELARIAHEQSGKFWELRAALIRDRRTQGPSRAELEQYANELGLDWEAARDALDQHRYQRNIVADGIFGAQFGVRDEPALFVNGRKLSGAPTVARLSRLIDEEKDAAQAKLNAGVLPENVYWELTKDALWKVE